jgi:hypothetical protein
MTSGCHTRRGTPGGGYFHRVRGGMAHCGGSLSHSQTVINDGYSVRGEVIVKRDKYKHVLSDSCHSQTVTTMGTVYEVRSL